MRGVEIPQRRDAPVELVAEDEAERLISPRSQRAAPSRRTAESNLAAAPGARGEEGGADMGPCVALPEAAQGVQRARLGNLLGARR